MKKREDANYQHQDETVNTAIEPAGIKVIGSTMNNSTYINLSI